MPTTLRRMIAVATGHARHCSAHGESGATIIEMAFSIGILLTFIFGIMEACLAAYTYHFLSEASREATRYAIVRGATYIPTQCSAPSSATCVAQAGDITTYVQSLNMPGIDPTKMTVSSTWLNSDGTACLPASDSCKIPGNPVQVTITYNFPLSVPFIPLSTWTMTSTSQMVISQ